METQEMRRVTTEATIENRGPAMLNERMHRLADLSDEDAKSLGVASSSADCGVAIYDYGVRSRGGLKAGQRLAEVCLAGLGNVAFVQVDVGLGANLAVQVITDHPIAACMASQYAGWEIKHADYFAMASGPMRAAAGREELFDQIGFREQASRCVGVLEASRLPPDDVCRDLAEKCDVEPQNLTILVARTKSLAGTVQIAARSVETALHKLHELGFDIMRIQSAYGTAPLPPPAADDLAAIGRTNDAILYGGQVTLYVRGDDASLEEFGPRTPSSASRDHGRPFADVFAGYNHDFYQVDPLLFSPAEVTFSNLETGRSFRFGRVEPDVLRKSFCIQ
jgi:methenyltetrahydromethanopterin cyclohydrolase